MLLQHVDTVVEVAKTSSEVILVSCSCLVGVVPGFARKLEEVVHTGTQRISRHAARVTSMKHVSIPMLDTRFIPLYMLVAAKQ